MGAIEVQIGKLCRPKDYKAEIENRRQQIEILKSDYEKLTERVVKAEETDSTISVELFKSIKKRAELEAQIVVLQNKLGEREKSPSDSTTYIRRTAIVEKYGRGEASNKP